MQAETETTPSVAPVVPVAVSLARISVGELCAVLSLMTVAGQTHPGVAQWQVLVTFVPWYAQATGRTLDQVYALPVDSYTVGVKDRLGSLQARVPDAIDGLGRIAALLGAPG